MPEHTHHPNVSADLIWEIARGQNAFLVKRKSGGGSQFSRDPLNLANKESRKYAGFVNDKAVGVSTGERGAIVLTTKKTKHPNRPAASRNEVKIGGGKSNQKIFKAIVNYTAKNGYRPDLRREAVARASALRLAGQPKKDLPEKKARGVKSKKAAEV
ncbi:hypothetical protein MMC25_007467 [Agyrium rufum]|nr:hypothetical protein [Agyrium rufum]